VNTDDKPLKSLKKTTYSKRTQNFIKLSAAVHELSGVQSKENPMQTILSVATVDSNKHQVSHNLLGGGNECIQ